MRAPRLLGDLASAFTMPTVLKLTAGSQPNSCYSPFCLRDFRREQRNSKKINIIIIISDAFMGIFLSPC